MEFEGITKSSTLREEIAEEILKQFELIKTRQWDIVLKNLCRDYINWFALDDKSLNTQLHYAALLNAPVEVIEKMIDFGAWRTIRNSAGEKPIDSANLMGNHHLLEVLKPVYFRGVMPETLLKIERNFHQMLMERAEWSICNEALCLPQLELLLEILEPKMYFSIPGYYGGFSYRLEINGTETKLITKGGSRMSDKVWNHEITASEIRQIF